jgi:diacylglycerol O-acyltransferase
MRQLTSLDAQFLALETPRQYGHTSGVAILDPSTALGGKLELDDIQQLILDRLPLLPLFRWRLAEVPLGLDYAYWVDDPDFDIDFHVRELALVPPGTNEQLEEQVARIFARPLDRTRPLWELYLIHGLEKGRVAMMTKIHHAVIDGISGAEILGVLLDVSPEGRPPPEAPAHNGAARVPSNVEMLLRGLMGLPRYPWRAALHPGDPAEHRGGRHLRRAARSRSGGRGGAHRAAHRHTRSHRRRAPPADATAHIVQRPGVAASARGLRADRPR